MKDVSITYEEYADLKSELATMRRDVSKLETLAFTVRCGIAHCLKEIEKIEKRNEVRHEVS